MFWILLLVAVASASNSGEQLNYNEQEHWGGICASGSNQSPIDIPVPSTTITVPSNGVFLNLPSSIKMVNINNANTAKYEITPSTVVNVPWAADRKITLVQLHLHWGATDARGSEHLINGKGYAAESHLVTSYIAPDGSTKYTVFARLFAVGESNKELEQMISGEKADGEGRNIPGFDLSALYPANASGWLTYQGGLTTPGCNEVVHWVILKDPLTVSPGQLSALRLMQLGHKDKKPMSRNWRTTQKTNDRKSTLFIRG